MALPSLRGGRGGNSRPSQWIAPVFLPGLRQDLQLPDRDAAGAAAAQGALDRIRRFDEQGRNGGGLGRALRRRRQHGFSVAASLSAGGERRSVKLRGIVEADETFVLASRKGERKLDRKPRKRGGKASKRGLSDELVPVLVAADRSGSTVSAVLPSVCAIAIEAVLRPVLGKDALLVTDGCTSYPPCAAALGVSHEALNQTAGERVRGDLHIQTVNSRHERLKDFLRRHRGIATKYLDSYLRWYHLAFLPRTPSPRAVLAAAAGMLNVRPACIPNAN